MVTAVKRTWPNNSTVMLDRDTIARLKESAGDMPLAAYLRELSLGLGGQVSTPYLPLMAKIEQILDEHNLLIESLMSFKKQQDQTKTENEVRPEAVASKKESDPGVVVVDETAGTFEEYPAEDYEKILANLKSVDRKNVFDDDMLKKYDRAHPTGEGRCGYYNRDASGKWSFDQKRCDEAMKRIDLEKDAIAAYYDALALKKVKPIRDVKKIAYTDDAFSNSMIAFSEHRKLVIAAGMKLLEEMKQKKASRSRK